MYPNRVVKGALPVWGRALYSMQRDGYIVTNSHVIDKAEDIVVTLEDGQRFNATVIGKDPGADIAVIQVEAGHLTEIPLGDSDRLRQGDFCGGDRQSVWPGPDRNVRNWSAHSGEAGSGSSRMKTLFKPMLPLIPATRGGALVNLRGELIGINTALYGSGGGNIGIGFAIPVNMAKQITSQLIEHGEVRRGRLGFVVQDLTPELAEAFGVDRKKAWWLHGSRRNPLRKKQA